MKRIMITRET